MEKYFMNKTNQLTTDTKTSENLIKSFQQENKNLLATIESLKMLSNAVEQTADSVVITDIKGIIEYVNPAFEKTTGFDRLEVIGKTPRLLKSGKHDQTFYNNLWNSILAGNMHMGTIINKKKNGDLYWSEQTISSMKDGNGVITNFVSVLKDVTELRNQQEQEYQMNIAKELQQRFLRSNFSLPGFDIAGKTYSAAKTCGDFYDFITFPNNCAGIIIGDVCGHGIGAAFIMAVTRAYIRAFSQKESDPGKILNLVNDRLVDDLDNEHFVTLTLVRIDPQKNLMDYASGGHIPSYLINRTGETSFIIESTGIPLGIIKDYNYTKAKRSN
jgi:phosphoserine phosphatase RsbU/P